MHDKRLRKKRAVVLLSGGLDSATTLYFAREKGFLPFCLVFDYGQRHSREIASAQKLARHAGCPCTVLTISLPWKGSSLLDRKLKVPEGKAKRRSPNRIPNTYVPARNIIFLSFALSYAEALGAGAIFIGANAVDYSGYPDCRPQFFQAYERVIAFGTKTGIAKQEIKVYTPLVDLSKAQIIKLGRALKVPFAYTWSCYRGAQEPCRTCDSCVLRARGFRQAGIADPLLRT